MSSRFDHRSQQEELMDDLNSSGEVIEQTLRELDTINKWLGGDHVTLNGLEKLIEGMPEKDEIHILDIGCGGGDLLMKICRWARKRSINLRLTGIDANPNIIAYARNHTRDYPEISYQALNIFSEEFQKISCDIVTATLFTHHFTDEQLISLFKQLKHQAASGMVINDLHRHWFAYHSIKVLTSLFSQSEMVRNDAALSVLRSFHKEELNSILQDCGISDYSLEWFWAFRWQLLARW
jgi:2-polyprenyl-3-methyl-5-hydroxy-6-metoxy-1,4-benzoquinol methylase